jgi:hypothetical protein
MENNYAMIDKINELVITSKGVVRKIGTSPVKPKTKFPEEKSQEIIEMEGMI